MDQLGRGLHHPQRLTVWVLLRKVRPVMLGYDLIISARGSIRRLNMEGKRGHPCLVPLVKGNGRESLLEL